ncbi:hypothetical protein [Cellulomonas hominis]|uniref:hypothetical protein n=1 Tax=Cellulomonas hominis TaxID=156981 RepID=UPI001BD17F5B|nr:hypothetical protein [Cellulomonas hominis]
MPQGGRARFEIRQFGDETRVVDASGVTLPKDVADLVNDLRSARRDEDAAKDRQRSIVQQLVAAGASWSVIGWCVGISREMARRRFSNDQLK